MRLFAALELDERARQRIGEEQKRVRRSLGDPPALRWVDPASMHVTLAFLGEVGEPVAQQVIGAMTGAFEAAPFRLVFRGTGVFPSRGAPRVLWLGIAGGAADAIALQAAVAERLNGCGIVLERRAFTPHLTLARFRDCRSAKASRPPQANASHELRRRSRHGIGRDERERPPAKTVAAVDVREVVLFQSRLSPKGSTYVALARAPLVPPVPPLQ